MQTKWDLTQFYKSPGDPQIEIDKQVVWEKAKWFAAKWQNRTDYLSDPKILKEALDEYCEFCRLYANGGNPYYYLKLSNVLDQIDPVLKAKVNKISDLAIEIQNLIQFFELSLVNVKTTKINSYQHFLEKIIRQKPHLLSDKEEKIMNLKSLPAYDFWVEMTEKFLSRENISVLQSQMTDTNKKIRATAAKKFNEIMEKYSDVAEHELNAILQDKKINDQIRNYDRPDIARHLADDIETEVVDTLVKTVSNNFKIAHDYYKLKAKILGVKKLNYYERNMPVGKFYKKFSLEETIKLVSKTFGEIDPQYKEIFEKLLTNGQIDFMPVKGKASGAACWHNLLSQPTFLFQNFTGKLRDVTTLAHEMGHAINNELVRAKQNALNFGTPTSTAEVASTFMEDFILQEILKNISSSERLSVLMEKLDDDISTIFRQVALYNFETELHTTFRQKGFLSKEEINKLFIKHMDSYCGSYVDLKGAKNWWVYWSHIRYYFYVYSYAGGLLISKYLQRNKSNIKEFLSAGLSDSPKNIFSKLGINISDAAFWQTGIDEIKTLLEETKKLV
ncbi:MAG: M3 family oligoendopeptidase [bacterium]|nr:M3 family oligoendopeptidase [bacterium]